MTGSFGIAKSSSFFNMMDRHNNGNCWHTKPPTCVLTNPIFRWPPNLSWSRCEPTWTNPSHANYIIKLSKPRITNSVTVFMASRSDLELALNFHILSVSSMNHFFLLIRRFSLSDRVFHSFFVAGAAKGSAALFRPLAYLFSRWYENPSISGWNLLNNNWVLQAMRGM